MTYNLSNLFKPTPIRMKVLGKALATAASSAALLNTVNGGNVKISVALIAFAFLGTFLMEFFADAKPGDVFDAGQKAVAEIQSTPLYEHTINTFTPTTDVNINSVDSDTPASTTN